MKTSVSAFFIKIIAALLAAAVPVATCLVMPFTKPFDKEPGLATEKAGGFVKGVCHPYEQYDLIKQANIEWIRVDIPVPCDINGNENIYYGYFKSWIQSYRDNGIKVFAVTPMPKDYLAMGIDYRTPEGAAKITEIARFLAADLKDLVKGFQVSNEMGIDRFTAPLTIEEAAEFVGVQIEAMEPVTRDYAILGYNLGGEGYLNFLPKMKDYNRYCDYVGCDIYLGCFETFVKNIDTFIGILALVRAYTGKPIMLNEFGYIGYGEPKTEQEKREILQTYGFSSEDEVRADVNAFISRLPEPIRREFDLYYADRSDEEKFDLLFNGEYSNHIYRELETGTGLYGYEHTPEGQAKFFADLIPKLRRLPWCIGAFIYMWHDSEACYVCGQKDCPVETGWGLVDGSGEPKPAYYAVQKAFE